MHSRKVSHQGAARGIVTVVIAGVANAPLIAIVLGRCMRRCPRLFAPLAVALGHNGAPCLRTSKGHSSYLLKTTCCYWEISSLALNVSFKKSKLCYTLSRSQRKSMPVVAGLCYTTSLTTENGTYLGVEQLPKLRTPNFNLWLNRSLFFN